MTSSGSTLGSALLITGCCIGAGMLGLPVITATAGFLPTSIAMFLCCLFMASTALLLLEATLWFGSEASLISMSSETIGKAGSTLTWFLFLFLFYGLGIAYTAGCGELVGNALSSIADVPSPHLLGSILSLTLVGAFIYTGTLFVDYVNRALMLGLIATYLALIAMGAAHMDPHKLTYASWPATFATVPILIISFGFHNLIPSLTHYLRYNVSKMRRAILFGCFGAFVINIVWEVVILGLLPPPGSLSLGDILDQGGMVTHHLRTSTGAAWILPFAHAFAFCAITTSILANSLSFVDFLADGFGVHPQGFRRLLLCTLVLLPPLCIASVSPNLFLKALHIAGGTAAVILFGVLPALIVWVGRYRQQRARNDVIPGGKLTLSLLIVIALGILTLEIALQLT